MAEPKRYITSEELKSHHKRGDLWISIQGKVYDVTEWANDHPGGESPLLNLAGQDATDAFVAYHPGAAWKYLDKYFNGYYLEDYAVSEASKDYRKLVYEFTKMGLFEKKGHGVFVSLSFIAMLFAVSVYGVVCCEGMLVHLLCGGMMGFLWIQSGWIGHDSGHYQVMLTPKLNRFVQVLTGNCLAGISIGWWKWNHNAHHIACNSLDHDPDLQHMPVFAVSSKFFTSLTSYFYERKMNFDCVCRFLVSHQHLTFYPVMCIARLNLFAQSFILLLSKRKVPHRAEELTKQVILQQSLNKEGEMASSIVSTNAAAAVSRAAPAQASMVAPFTGLRSSAAFPLNRRNADITSIASNGGRVQCMKVWPTEGLRKFETLSYLPPLTREQLIKQIDYLIRLGLIPCLEFTNGEAFPYRENNRSPGYYDGRYWTMWKLPMFGCTDPVQVVKELEEAVSYHPQACVRIIGFDKIRQVQIISFIAHKRPGLVVE